MACSKPFDNATMRARATQLTELFKKEKIPLECVYTSWEDAMRAFGSALGPNIADIGLQFKSTDGSATKVYGFKCRSNNFAEVLVEIDARKYKIIVCDPNGQNPRGIYLDDALKNAGKYFAHCGLPDDCDLYDEAVDNGKVKLRMDVIFAPKGAIPEGQEFANTEFCLTKYSYQARTGNARNIDLFSHPQGTACSDDTSGQKMLRPQVYDPETKKLNEFWFEAEDTGKDVEDMHTETAAESAAAAARGKGTAVRSGMDGWEKLPNLFHFIQIPREQERSVPVRSSISQPYASAGAAGAASAWAEGPPTKSFKASAGASMPPSGLDPDEEEEDVQEEEAGQPCYRSLAGPPRAAPATITSARLSRGSFAEEGKGVQSKTVKRAKGEPITISCTMVLMIDGDGEPPIDKVKSIWDKVKTMMKIAGEAKDLHDPKAGLTTGAPLAEKDLLDITEKQKDFPAPPQMPVAPIVGMVVE